MKIVLIAIGLFLTLTACQAPTIEKRAIQTWDIYVYRANEDDKVCIHKTRTAKNNCSNHKDNKSCNVPGDTLRWTWQQRSETSPFKIEAKSGNTSPFLPDPACTATATTVVCTIDKNTDVDVYDYAVTANPGTPQECKLDPRILIN